MRRLGDRRGRSSREVCSAARLAFWFACVAILLGLAAPAQSVAALVWSAPVLTDHVAPFADSASGGSVACPSVSFCVAFDGRAVVTSRRPARLGTWSDPRPVFSGGNFSSGSCPSVSLCVAVSDAGGIAVSSDPASGDWRTSQVVSLPTLLRGVSCPSVALCVAVDSVGDVITSHRPTGGASAWKVTRVESGRGPLGEAYAFNAVSCPSVSLCVIVDDAGDVLTSRDPAGGAATWKVTAVGPQSPGPSNNFYGYSGVSCSSVSACVAVSTAGYLASSRNPTGGPGAWTVTHLVGSAGLEGISCASVSFCAAAGLRSIAWSRDPTAREPRWAMHQLGSNAGGQSGVSCPSTSLCVAVAGSVLAATTKPTARAPRWRMRSVPESNSLDAVSCPLPSFCVAVDDAGHVVSSSKPTGGRSAWRAAEVPNSTGLSAVSCAARSLCIAVDMYGGNLFTSRHPTRRRAAWRIAHLENGYLYDVSCPSVSLCLATDGAGNVFMSRDPTGGARTWRMEHVDTATFLCDAESDTTCRAALTGGISCPTVSFCLAVDDAGDVVISTDPGADSSTWTLDNAHLGPPPDTYGPGFGPTSAVSCASRHLCVIVWPTGTIDTSTNPTGGPAAWTQIQVDASVLNDVSCAPASFCVAVDAAGNVLASSDPAGGAAAWSAKSVNRTALTGVSCATRSLCVAVDGWGYAVIGRTTKRSIRASPS
jgi:hypothetical protein